MRSASSWVPRLSLGTGSVSDIDTRSMLVRDASKSRVETSFDADSEACRTPRFGRVHAGPVGLKVTLAVESQLVKATSEDLSQLLVNFAEVDAVFAQWPCLRAQLARHSDQRVLRRWGGGRSGETSPPAYRSPPPRPSLFVVSSGIFPRETSGGVFASSFHARDVARARLETHPRP